MKQTTHILFAVLLCVLAISYMCSAYNNLSGLRRVRQQVAVSPQAHPISTDVSHQTNIRSPIGANIEPRDQAPTSIKMIQSLPPEQLYRHDVELQNSLLSSYSAEALQFYSPLFRKLGLTPDQIAQFTSLMRSEAETRTDILAVSSNAGLDWQTNPAVQELLKQASSEREQGLRDLLGPAGYGQLRQLRDSRAARDFVLLEIIPQMYAAAVPPSSDQVEKLVEQSHAMLFERFNAGGQNRYRFKSEIDPEFLKSTQALLTSEQLGALKIVLEAHIAKAAISTAADKYRGR